VDRNPIACVALHVYPEEGKYHYDGHRKCNVRLAPRESILNTTCARSAAGD
jgi:hypothetical protein